MKVKKLFKKELTTLFIYVILDLSSKGKQKQIKGDMKMNVRIFHNGELFLEGENAVADYVGYDNEYDEVVTYLLHILGDKDYVEHSHRLVGNWRVERMQG